MSSTNLYLKAWKAKIYDSVSSEILQFSASVGVVKDLLLFILSFALSLLCFFLFFSHCPFLSSRTLLSLERSFAIDLLDLDFTLTCILANLIFLCKTDQESALKQ